MRPRTPERRVIAPNGGQTGGTDWIGRTKPASPEGGADAPSAGPVMDSGKKFEKWLNTHATSLRT
ncbi:hypothetical protein GCM10010344_34250 [Streptomyces bluensis]|nr:hypothetical protein GCM10010344_34250 [Streptomyces bluensis]